MSTFSAVVSQEGDYWLAEVPDLPGGRSYARSLASLRRKLTDAIILAADLPDDADVRVTFTADDRLPVEVRESFAVAAERDEVAERTSRLSSDTARLARALKASGLSVRDTAGALGITSGRVSQLVKSK